MNCPRCWQPWVCGCKNCAPDNKGRMLWKWTPDGEAEICPACGFTASADWWFDEQFFQLPSEHQLANTRISKWSAEHIKSRPMMNRPDRTVK